MSEPLDYEALAAGLEGPEVEISAEGVAQAANELYPVGHPKYQGLAEAKGYDQSDPNSRLQSLRYNHEAMIDVIIARPAIKQNELAKIFDKSVPWISRIIGSDSFQAALAKRREDLTDPFLIATIEERFRGVAIQSLDIIAEKLETTKNTDLALKSLDVSVKALGFGARSAGGPGQTNQFIIQLPPKMANSSEWAEQHSVKQVGSGGSNG